jgi:hypothetical protein
LEARSILSFDFSALNYVDPARTRYRYRLEGLESKWNETDSTRRTVTYTTLPAGNYTLRVQARATRGDWTESGVALPIHILPPWYATVVFPQSVRGGLTDAALARLPASRPAAAADVA